MLMPALAFTFERTITDYINLGFTTPVLIPTSIIINLPNTIRKVYFFFSNHSRSSDYSPSEAVKIEVCLKIKIF